MIRNGSRSQPTLCYHVKLFSERTKGLQRSHAHAAREKDRTREERNKRSRREKEAWIIIGIQTWGVLLLLLLPLLLFSPSLDGLDVDSLPDHAKEEKEEEEEEEEKRRKG